jgi:type I restriction enzyme R subunit
VRNYSEDILIEQPTIDLFAELGYATANTFHEKLGRHGTLGRETEDEVVLVPRLRVALQRLNPDLPYEAIELAIKELTRDRSALSPANANSEIYQSLKNGIPIRISAGEDAELVEVVRVIDWNNPTNNDFFLASQFWISGEMYRKRADLVGFINGLPLIFIELKTAHKRVENAYHDNLRDYKDTIPQIFWYNAFIILSNGHQSRIGSMTAGWEHFFEWKKISNEQEKGVVSLETMIRGTCEKSRLLDIVENFTLFSSAGGALVKLIAKNHQFLGVNNALAAVSSLRDNQGRLGVFWHTQGSGKSYSMVFFSQKVLRKIIGNWTFLIVTDRQELDDQIYKTFQDVGAVTEIQVQAESGDHLKQLLQEDHRNIFTLIHKFRTEKGQNYPKLSDRSDIIVMTDEAHRTQYDILALNMRNALPNAAFIGFTGTPLIVGEEKTRQVFGDYVSIYNFRQSVEDGTTVALYYENRIPALQLTNVELNTDMEELIGDVELNEGQQRRLEHEFAREYQLITRDERLEKIAEDIVAHFMSRGQMGKAMVISIDKATAVCMYNKVQKYWQRYLEGLKKKLAGYTKGGSEWQLLQQKITYMETTDMAVVISKSQNEIDDLRRKGLDIIPHRRRMEQEDLEMKFKDADEPLRIVFVCAMWITGFDVPSLSTLYLDKPMRNHTLMQTIARANRVFEDKVSGLIVDYAGVFRDLQKALAIYGSGSGGDIKEGDVPVKDKGELVTDLRSKINETRTFCEERGIDIQAILAATPKGFQRISLVQDAVDVLVVNDEIKKKYLSLANSVAKLYKAILPDLSATAFSGIVALFVVIAREILSLASGSDISEIMGGVEQLLDISVATKDYIIREPDVAYETQPLIDLNQIDFDALQAQFKTKHKHIEFEKLRGAVEFKLKKMVRLNKSRTDYFERFQRLIDAYNTDSENVELHLHQLMAFTRTLNQEEQRHISEQLSEEELAIFDLLTRPNPPLTEQEKSEVKKVARTLLETLKREKLVLDWRKKQQAKADVHVTIEEILDRLPPSYSQEVYVQLCIDVFQHVYESYFGQGKSVYAMAS